MLRCRPDKIQKMREALDHLTAARKLLHAAGLHQAAEDAGRAMWSAEDAVRDALTPRSKPRLVK